LLTTLQFLRRKTVHDNLRCVHRGAR
jgi:hypothetical protein